MLPVELSFRSIIVLVLDERFEAHKIRYQPIKRRLSKQRTIDHAPSADNMTRKESLPRGHIDLTKRLDLEIYPSSARAEVTSINRYATSDKRLRLFTGQNADLHLLL